MCFGCHWTLHCLREIEKYLLTYENTALIEPKHLTNMLAVSWDCIVRGIGLKFQKKILLYIYLIGFYFYLKENMSCLLLQIFVLPCLHILAPYICLILCLYGFFIGIELFSGFIASCSSHYSHMWNLSFLVRKAPAKHCFVLNMLHKRVGPVCWHRNLWKHELCSLACTVTRSSKKEMIFSFFCKLVRDTFRTSHHMSASLGMFCQSFENGKRIYYLIHKEKNKGKVLPMFKKKKKNRPALFPLKYISF